ncbi:MAG: tetratricopeptide repeat protein, partial [Verrucomicrobia bacterium]|nr:tetratricopeptide repeat protein [Verrucomicrobiota bacterium]
MDKFFRFFPTLGFTAMLLLASAGCTAGLKAAWHLRRANADFAAGKFDQAAIEYQNVIHLDPSNPSAWAHLGIIYFRDGRLADIAPILQRAAALNSNDLEVRLDLGSIYLLAGQLKQARDQADFVLARDPANQTAPILLADTAVTNADVQSVRRRLQRLAQSRDTAPLEVALGTLAFTSHDTAIAQVCFKRAIALDPKFADAYSALGNLYLALKDPRAADPTLQQAAVLAPPRSGKQLQYAQFKIMTGDAEAGEKLLRQMTAQIPDYLPGWMALARLQASQTNYDACAISLGNVLSRDPSNFEAL